MVLCEFPTLTGLNTTPSVQDLSLLPDPGPDVFTSGGVYGIRTRTLLFEGQPA
jgi:hypothetical protein